MRISKEIDIDIDPDDLDSDDLVAELRNRDYLVITPEELNNLVTGLSRHDHAKVMDAARELVYQHTNKLYPSKSVA